jgi:hypothetical protein
MVPDAPGGMAGGFLGNRRIEHAPRSQGID